MKKIFKSFCVAFSIYSKIPMPRFNWGSEDMKYHLCFFPLIGVVIGLLEYYWNFIFTKFGLNQILYCSICIAIPLLITGGFHVDGFLDTMDALSSYQDKDKKLEILKDPHVGAFAIISLVIYLLLALGFISELKGEHSIIPMCFSFFFSRCLSGLSVVCFSKAKKDGMVATESKTDGKKFVKFVLLLEFFAGVCALLAYTYPYNLPSIFAISVIVLTFVYFYLMSKKNFGGITGDLCGFFVTVSELVALIGIVLVHFIFGV